MSRGSLKASPEGIEKAKNALKYCGLTQKALGEELEISRSTISKFFNNKNVDRTKLRSPPNGKINFFALLPAKL